jgi:hypothetical protein
MKAATQAHTVPKFYLQGFVAFEPKNGLGPFVWLGSLVTGEIRQRSPKSISIAPGLYDGPGGFDDPGRSIEIHLSKIEHAAAASVRRFAATDSKDRAAVPSEIWRFLAWQAARTPGWMDLEED